VIRVRCDVRGCRRLAVMQLRDLTDNSCRYACDGHRPAEPDRFDAEQLRPVCEWCGHAMPVPAREQGGGRTKRYCSGRCRTAAHRSRPAPWAPDTLHGALGTVPR
jgi:hypothetical protein